MANPLLSNKRKKRGDAGETVFNFDRRRDGVYTAVNMFRKERVMKATKDDPVSTVTVAASQHE
jgi:hypothetical protein